MIRVLHVITELRRGGAELSLLGLLESQDSAAFEHQVVAIGEDGPVGDQIRALGIKVAVLGVKAPFGGVRGIMRLRRMVSQWNPDVVQGWMYHGNLATRLALIGKAAPPPIVWNVRHSLSDIKREKWLTRRVIRAGARFSSGVSATIWNSAMSRTQHEAIGFHAQRHVVVHNGIDTDRVQSGVEARARTRSAWGISEKSRVVGSIARFHPMKGHRSLAEAVGQLSDRGMDVYLALAGRGCEPGGPAESAICDVPSVMDKVRFLGELENPSNAYSGFDVFVTPSGWGESFPNALVEAMASGVPCVATRLGAVPEIIDDDGFIVPPDDPGALAPVIEQVLSLSEPQRQSMVGRGRDRVLREYCRKKCTEQYERMWSDLGAKH